MKKLLIAIFFITPLLLFAGDPIPGIEIIVEQSPAGIVSTGKTGKNGEYTFKGLKDGNYIVTLNVGGKKIVVGKKPNEKINVSSVDGDPDRPVMATVTNPLYKGHGNSGQNPMYESSSMSTSVNAQNYNSSRSNKANGLRRNTNNESEEHTPDRQEAQNYNSSRSNKANGLRISVTPSKNNLKIKVIGVKLRK
ncbi:carboxypeptidase regulatory-like domain-containing protein [bacterium]|nr:MAG: carboxypeptidase regulatory-like domain-containing protein [bacterium]